MRRIALGIVVPLALSLASSGDRAQEIKLGTVAPEGTPWYDILRDMSEECKKATGGKVSFKIWAGGVIGDEPDMISRIRVDGLHAAALSGAGLSDIAQEVQALQMPMMLASYDELDYVMDRVSPRLAALLESKGFKVLAWGDAGWIHFFSQRPVRGPEDMKPMKLLVWGGPSAYVEAYKDAGYHPVPLAAPDIYMGLQSGMINAFATTPIAALGFQWFGLAKNMTDLNWAPLVGAIVISTKRWQQISEDAKPLVLKAAAEAGARIRGESRRAGDAAVVTMKKHGLVVVPVSAEEAAAWEKSARAAYPRLIGKVVPAEMVAEVERLRDEYRASRKP